MKTSSGQSKHASRIHSQSQNFQTWLDRYNNSWYPESTALLSSSVCAIAIAVILGYYDGKPSAKIAGITLNAVISTVGTASKALLIFAVSNAVGQLKWVWFNGESPRLLLDTELFDNASRGPLGASKLLLTDARRSAVSFGALLTILALAFDPFIQLVIDYETTPLYSNSTTAVLNRAGLYRVDPKASSTKYAIDSTFWRDDYAWQTPECPAEFCQWNNFTTLAWESKCYQDTSWTLSNDCNTIISADDVIRANGTDLGVRNCSVSRSKLPYHLATSHIDKSVSLRTYIESPIEDLNVELPKLDMWFDLMVPEAFSAVTYYGPEVWSYATMNKGKVPSGVDITSPFLMVSTFNLQQHHDWTIALGNVVTCELDLFIHTYNVNSTAASVIPSLKNTQPLRKSLEWKYEEHGEPGTYYWVCMRPDSGPNNFWFSTGAQGLPKTDSTNFIASNFSSDAINPSNATQYCITLNSNTWKADWEQLFKSVEGQRNMSLTFNDRVRDNTSDNVLVSWFHYNLSDPFRPSETYTSDNFNIWTDSPERVMKNMAASMTTLGLDPTLNINGTDPIYGEVGQVVSLVRVRWLWLILPYGLCVAGILFLLLTMHLSNRAGTPLWKSSVTALLYHGIDCDSLVFEQLSTIPEMDEQATRTTALLRPSGVNKKLMLEATIKRRKLKQEEDDDIDSP